MFKKKQANSMTAEQSIEQLGSDDTKNTTNRFRPIASVTTETKNKYSLSKTSSQSKGQINKTLCNGIHKRSIGPSLLKFNETLKTIGSPNEELLFDLQNSNTHHFFTEVQPLPPIPVVNDHTEMYDQNISFPLYTIPSTRSSPPGKYAYKGGPYGNKGPTLKLFDAELEKIYAHRISNFSFSPKHGFFDELGPKNKHDETESTDSKGNQLAKF